jgi:hypothetical protein
MEFMDEKTKSIWKKSWTGWGWLWAWLWAWLILLAVIFIVLLIVVQFIPNGPKHFFSMLPGVGIYSLVVSTGAIGLLAFARGFVYCCRHFKRFLFSLACLATLIALIYAEEDWRGWHAWNQFKHEWEAKGEKFDYASIVPTPVPDNQNFAMSLVWVAEIKYDFLTTPKRAESWYGDQIYSEDVSKILRLLPVSVSGLVGTNWWSVEYSPDFPKVSGQWATASLTDLKPWQSYYRGLEKTNPAVEIPIASEPQSPAADVLLALGKFDPVIEQLRRDSALPYSRFPIKYDTDDPAETLLPHLADVKRYAQVLQLRAIAELQDGQNERALADVKLSLRLAESIHTEPILISHLVRIAMLQITLQPVYEGLAEHKWSDAQLVALDAELAKLDFLADYKLSMRGELRFQVGFLDYLQRHPEQLYNVSGNFGGDKHLPLPGRIVIHLIPSGWFNQNLLHCARPMVELYVPAADADQQTISPSKVIKADATVTAQTRRANPYNIMERLLLPALGNAAKRFAHAQASVDLARAAIALERYRLARGEYPESLDALAPQFIAKVPHDVINGQPLKYRRTPDPSSQSSDAASGQFVLYSIGWNEKDDGGVVILTKGSTPTVDINQGDWVWRYPAK